MTKLRVLDCFSGLGGFSLGLERTGGFETVAFCEIEPFPRKVLAKHWPGVPQYDDVRTLTAEVLARDGIAVDVITGGFPCQDLSVAGKQRGMGEGTRSGLWSEIVRLIGELRPRYVIVENVAALLAGPSEKRGGWFGRVLGDLAECGYDAEWENIPASAVGASHRRERVWVVAYPSIQGWSDEKANTECPDANCSGPHRQEMHVNGNAKPGDEQKRVSKPLGSVLANANEIGRAEMGIPYQPRERRKSKSARKTDDAFPRREHSIAGWWLPEPDVGRVAHGVPDRSHRLAALGNAVIPQIPELIGRAILAAEKVQA
jgi:DNA (cytosine-5)-methyltransferase 1